AVEYGAGDLLEPSGDRVGEQPAHRVGGRGRREIEVVVLKSQEIVAQRAADAPRFEAGGLELPCNAQHLIGDGQTVRELHRERGNGKRETWPSCTIPSHR